MIYRSDKFFNRVYEYSIERIEIDLSGIWMITTSDNAYSPDDFGKIVFLTREEAESALKKMEER